MDANAGPLVDPVARRRLSRGAWPMLAVVLLLAGGALGMRPGSAAAATPTAVATPAPGDLATFAGLLGEGELGQPSDIAVGPDGTIWVTDEATDTLHEFDAEGRHLRAFGETGQAPGQFEFADFGAVGVDGAGNVYVLDSGNERVQKFAPDLTFRLAWGGNGSDPGEFLHPSDIAVRDDGAVFVIDARTGKLQQFDASGRFVRELLPSGMAEAFSEAATRLGLDPAGNLYVPDLNRIYVFDRDGRNVRTIQTTEIHNGSLYLANGAAVDESGYLYVSDWQASNVVVFDPAGRVVGSWGSRGTEPGQFDEIDALAIDGAGRLLVLDYANRRIQIFALAVHPDAESATPVAA